eukprot:sb/3472537/
MPTVVFHRNGVIRGISSLNGEKERFQINTETCLSCTIKGINKTDWESCTEFRISLAIEIINCDVGLNLVDYKNSIDAMGMLNRCKLERLLQILSERGGVGGSKKSLSGFGPARRAGPDEIVGIILTRTVKEKIEVNFCPHFQNARNYSNYFIWSGSTSRTKPRK